MARSSRRTGTIAIERVARGPHVTYDVHVVAVVVALTGSERRGADG